MTCIGIILYLLYLHSYNLAILTLIVFAPLIGFHFAITKLSKIEDLTKYGSTLDETISYLIDRELTRESENERTKLNPYDSTPQGF
jgi:hypothetical protein